MKERMVSKEICKIVSIHKQTFNVENNNNNILSELNKKDKTKIQQWYRSKEEVIGVKVFIHWIVWVGGEGIH